MSIFRLKRLATAAIPTANTNDAGRIVYDNTTATVKYCDGTSWANVAGAAANHAILSSSHSDSVAAGVSRGSLIHGNSTPNWAELVIGGANTVLKSDGTDASWGTIPSGAFTAGAIVNADINATAGITVGKVALTTGSMILGAASVGSALDVTGDGKIIVGNGTTATSVAVSGDCTLANTGAMTVTDLTISGETQGDILYRNATNWVRLAKPGSSGYFLEGGTTPAWNLPSLASASSIQTGATLLDAGALDATQTHTQQTVGGASVVIPDFAAAAAFTYAFLSKAQTFSANQTVQYGKLLLGDNDNGQTLQLLVNENMTGNKTLTFQPNDGSRIINMAGNLTMAGDLITSGAFSVTLTATAGTNVTLPTTGTLATLAGTETLSAKTLTAPKIATTGAIVDGGGDEYLVFVEDAAPITYVQITSAATTVAPIISGAGEANTGLRIRGAGTGKVTICDGATIGKALNFELVSATDTKTMTITSSHTNDRVLALPDVTDTLVGKATTDTLTNKTLTTPTLTTPVVNGVKMAYAAKSAGYTMTAADYCVDVSGAAGAVVITLPAAAGITGTVYVIKNSDAAQTVTIDGNGAETIDGAATVAMSAQYQFRMIISDGTNWKVISS